MEYEIEYDRTDPSSIEAYAKRLIGMTFREVLVADESQRATVLRETARYGISDVEETKRNKGNLGQILEERFFHYSCNSDSRADFPEAGVELKVTPYKINQDGTLSAKERLILTMIDYFNVVNETFEDSHFWKKSKLILLIYYLYTKDTKYNLDYKIRYSKLFTPPEQDVRIIKHDYYFIIGKIKEGKAHELSEGDTLYLGAASKASTSKDRRKQPFSNELAKPRAFAFKTSYMTYVLNNYVVPGRDTYEPIIKENIEEPFEDYVINRIERYKGFSFDELSVIFQYEENNNAKNREAILVYRILGIKGNKAEEFVKANIKVKTIRIEKNNRIRENMSFSTFEFKKIIEEDWENSSFGNYLRETRFLFVVFKYDDEGELILMGCQFWNMPYHDLEVEVRKVWERTVQVIKDGLEITEINGRRCNNLPKATESSVCHVRPHARNAADAYELPDGRSYTKQCFWLNNSYIYEQIEKRLKE